MAEGVCRTIRPAHRASGPVHAGKSRSPVASQPRGNPLDNGDIHEDADARKAIDEAARNVSPRARLESQPGFSKISPEPGELDNDAFNEMLVENPDEALVSLASAHRSADPKLRDLVRSLAGRVIVDMARTTHGRRRGIDRLIREPWTPGADIDLDASLGAVAESRALGQAIPVDDLMARRWARSDHALCLIIDWSGSMGGDRLASAALAAAVMASRAPEDYSVVAIARDAIIIKEQNTVRRVEEVVDDVLTLRGFGTTNLELGLAAAADQLARSRSPRKVAVLLSDGNSTVGANPEDMAKMLDELHVVAPPDAPNAAALAKVGGGRSVEVSSPSSIPEALLGLMR